ncbi:MAG: hypothetical protein ETSY1_46710 (plasmid) [Candidatus Entotheonella factor]|uniref:HTH cro/C1-type domain-containing protein n=1 Tax=Entotheonella factor TaxID=1429438 RepID=W4LZT2_ENTF1|nr:MAG: hypothetical protein ETSY1_46710 [Candidatus Entotheonella factor]
MAIGLQLKLARVGQGIKAKDLARQAGIAPKYLSQIENGKAPGLSVEVLGRLCRALGAEPNVIMEWEPGEAP